MILAHYFIFFNVKTYQGINSCYHYDKADGLAPR